jgi:hypothetical protein
VALTDLEDWSKAQSELPDSLWLIASCCSLVAVDAKLRWIGRTINSGRVDDLFHEKSLWISWDSRSFHELLSALVSLRWNLESCHDAHKHDRYAWRIEVKVIASYYTPTDHFDREPVSRSNSRNSPYDRSSSDPDIVESAKESIKVHSGQEPVQSNSRCHIYPTEPQAAAIQGLGAEAARIAA